MLIEQISTRPTCDVNGIIGGYTGEGAKTVIAAQAIGESLVPPRRRRRTRKRSATAFRAFVRARLPADCYGRVQQSRPAARRSRCRSTTRRSARRARRCRRNGARRRSRSAPAARSRSSATSSACSAWTRSGRLRARRRPRAFAEREIRSQCFHKGTRSWARILAALAG